MAKSKGVDAWVVRYDNLRVYEKLKGVTKVRFEPVTGNISVSCLTKGGVSASSTIKWYDPEQYYISFVERK
jgi:hypothetical protein